MSEIPGKLSEIVRARKWHVNFQQFPWPWTSSWDVPNWFREFHELVRVIPRTSSENSPNQFVDFHELVQGITPKWFREFQMPRILLLCFIIMHTNLIGQWNLYSLCAQGGLLSFICNMIAWLAACYIMDCKCCLWKSAVHLEWVSILLISMRLAYCSGAETRTFQ